MPPLEALKLLCALCMTRRVSNRGKKLRIAVYDISRAHFYAESDRQVFVTLPEEDALKHPGCCGLLRKCMYGRQDAANLWQADYSDLLGRNGYAVGKAHKAVFYNAEVDARCMVHGDDFVVLADCDGQEHFQKLLGEKYDSKVVGWH